MTFLTRKIGRILSLVAVQERFISNTDNLIEHHYEVIKQLKRKQKKANSIKDGLYSDAGFIVPKLTDKERYDLARGNKK